MLNCQADLGEQIQHFNFTEKLASSLLLSNASGQVTTICILHHETEFVFAGAVDLSKPNDVWVVQLLQNLHLSCSYLSLLRTHV